MLIRDARKNEREMIKDLRLEAYQEHEHKIPKKHWKVLKQQILSDEEQGAEQIVAEIDGKIAGCVVLFPPKSSLYDGMLEEELDYPEIRRLAVSPEFLGRDIARALIEECIRRTRK